MPSLLHSARDPIYRQLGRGESNVDHFDRITSVLPFFETLGVVQATQGTLKGEVGPRLDQGIVETTWSNGNTEPSIKRTPVTRLPWLSTFMTGQESQALHVMRSEPQIASRFEQLELPVWTESQELRRFIAGYLTLLRLKKSAAEIDKRFVEYLLALSDGVTERIIDILRRDALQGIVDKTQNVGLPQLQYVGAQMPTVIGQRS